MDGIHPDILAEYYGVDHQPEGPVDSHLSDSDEEPEGGSGIESEDDNNVEVEAIATHQAGNFNAVDAVDVPQSHSPFAEDEDLNEFRIALQVVNAANLIPHGYGLLPEEWEEETYPTLEVLRSGRRGGREITVGLPEQVWRSRAELWGRALDVLSRILHLD